MKKYLCVFALVSVLLASCATTGVKRVDADTQIDLSGYWNDTDVKIVCEALIRDCLSSPRVDQAIRAMGGRIPVVLVGTFRNESMEHIDTSIISSRMETAIFNSGKMDFVAGGSIRDQLRAERQDQQSNASEATASALANETGADFMLFGTVRTIVDRAGNQTVRTYFVNAEMTNIATNQRMWMGENSEIKKVVTQA
ncbi:MAG: penicillin-binding protein activator LpoB, partial [Treponema sp.]|nr:penicillin-binding protein activator LpoB [Treponema sp.]